MAAFSPVGRASRGRAMPAPTIVGGIRPAAAPRAGDGCLANLGLTLT